VGAGCVKRKRCRRGERGWGGDRKGKFGGERLREGWGSRGGGRRGGGQER